MYDIKKRRKELKLTLQEVADEVNVSPSTVRKWEIGMIKNMGRDKVSLLAKVLKINPSVLTDDELDWDSTISKDSRPQAIQIPVLGEVAAGVPISAIEDILDYEEISEEMARTGEYFGLRIKGDSMQPKMDDGDVVIVKQQSDVDSGDTAIVLVNGDSATCKKIQKHDNGLTLISTNPIHPPRFFTNKEIQELPVVILGKVVELRAKF